MIDRRIVLTAVLGAAATLASAQQPQSIEPSPFVGSWDVAMTPEEGGPPPFRALLTFHADGTLLESDDGPPTPHLFTAGHGAWASSGRREILATYRQINFDEAANLTGLLKVRLRLRVDRNQGTLAGPMVVDFLDPDGKPVFTGHGTVYGTRIEVEPLE